MRRYLASDGMTGESPDWYAVVQAAKYLNVAPWELIDASVYWKDKALIAMTAESQAQELKQKQADKRR